MLVNVMEWEGSRYQVFVKMFAFLMLVCFAFWLVEHEKEHEELVKDLNPLIDKCKYFR